MSCNTSGCTRRSVGRLGRLLCIAVIGMLFAGSSANAQDQACCFPDQTCQEVPNAGICPPGSVSQGNDTNCNTAVCPNLLGACCLCDGTCMDGISEADCNALNSQFFELNGACPTAQTCDDLTPVIDIGPTTVCPEQQDVTYGLSQFSATADYLWTISAGQANAVIDGDATDPASVIVDVLSANCANDTFDLTITCTEPGNGCVTEDTLTVVIEDTTPPVFTTFPMDMTVECDGAGNAADVMAFEDQTVEATDACGGVTITRTDCTLSDLCGATGTCTVTWTATDDCGNSTDAMATFTIEDTTPPTFTTLPMDMTVECDGTGNPTDVINFENQTVEADDDCGDVTITRTDCMLTDDCGATGTCTVTWTATDRCNNTSTAMATFTIEDTADPEITTAPMDMTVECDGQGNPDDVAAFEDQLVEAEDACGDVTITRDDCMLSDGCGATGSCTVTWTATDDCGNTSTAMATFTIVDTTPPMFTTPPMDMMAECDGAGNPAEVMAFEDQLVEADDACGDVTITHTDCTLTDDCGATGMCTVTWTATDDCGNSVSADATFTIVDTTPPMFTTPPADMMAECDGAGNPAEVMAFEDQTVEASDDCGDVTITRTDCTLTDDCGATGMCMVTWTATDECGNSATATATFTIVDTTPPMIECPPKDIVSCADGPPKPDITLVTASDICGDVTVTFVGDAGPQQGCDRLVIRTYMAEDECGNTSTCTQEIYVDRLHPGWNWVDNMITLTANEPTYWSALTGLPKGLSPFTVLDPGFPPGRPAMDGSDDRVLRGYVVGWAVDQFGNEIRWNHLKGEGTIINYRDDYAWEYNTWNHAVVSAVDNGAPLGEPGVLRLDGNEYSLSFDELLLNFQAAGSDGFSGPMGSGFAVESDTDLTLFPPAADLRQNNDGPVTTKASMDIWNENETKFSGTHHCITCWDQTLISRYDTPNSFLYPFLQTDHGKARIDGHAADVCNELDDPETPEDESVTSIASPLLGVYARLLKLNGEPTAASGSNLVGMGTDDTAVLRYDVTGGGGGPPEGQWPPEDPSELVDWMVRLANGEVQVPSRQATPTDADFPVEPAQAQGPGGQDRGSATEKGSLVFFSKVEIRWDEACELYQDTILSLTNDFPKDVQVQLYFINGDAPITATPEDENDDDP